MLDVLATNPKHHRRGAAKLLLQWGLDRADQAGWETYVEASPMGRGVYPRFQFKLIKTFSFGFLPFEDDNLAPAVMVRPPQKQDGTAKLDPTPN